MIKEKVQSFYDNLKQKENQGSEVGEFKNSQGWFDNVIKKLALKHVKRTGEAASANERQQTSSQMLLRKSLKRKGICQNRVLMQAKVSYSWGWEMPQKTFISKEEKWAPRFRARRDLHKTLCKCSGVSDQDGP